MQRITIECTNEGFCKNYGVKRDLPAYIGYIGQSYICNECHSHMHMEFADDDVKSKQEEGPETARTGGV